MGAMGQAAHRQEGPGTGLPHIHCQEETGSETGPDTKAPP